MMRVILIVLFAAVLTQETPRNPDDYVGPEDPAHQGQPKSCTNVTGRVAVKHDCPCVKTSCAPGLENEDPECVVYCRKPACKCDHGCETE